MDGSGSGHATDQVEGSESGHSVHTQEKTFPYASNAIMNMSVREQTNHSNKNKRTQERFVCLSVCTTSIP